MIELTKHCEIAEASFADLFEIGERKKNSDWWKKMCNHRAHVLYLTLFLTVPKLEFQWKSSTDLKKFNTEFSNCCGFYDFHVFFVT